MFSADFWGPSILPLRFFRSEAGRQLRGIPLVSRTVSQSLHLLFFFLSVCSRARAYFRVYLRSSRRPVDSRRFTLGASAPVRIVFAGCGDACCEALFLSLSLSPLSFCDSRTFVRGRFPGARWMDTASVLRISERRSKVANGTKGPRGSSVYRASCTPPMVAWLFASDY